MRRVRGFAPALAGYTWKAMLSNDVVASMVPEHDTVARSSVTPAVSVPLPYTGALWAAAKA